MSETHHPYRDEAHNTRDGHRRVHATAEETHVRYFDAADGWVSVAVDIDPRDSSVVAAEPIAFHPTESGCRERTADWLQDNPKGLADSSGLLDGWSRSGLAAAAVAGGGLLFSVFVGLVSALSVGLLAGASMGIVLFVGGIVAAAYIWHADVLDDGNEETGEGADPLDPAAEGGDA